MRVRVREVFLEQFPRDVCDLGRGGSRRLSDVEAELRPGWVVVGGDWIPASRVVLRGVTEVQEQPAKTEPATPVQRGPEPARKTRRASKR